MDRTRRFLGADTLDPCEAADAGGGSTRGELSTKEADEDDDVFTGEVDSSIVSVDIALTRSEWHALDRPEATPPSVALEDDALPPMQMTLPTSLSGLDCRLSTGEKGVSGMPVPLSAPDGISRCDVRGVGDRVLAGRGNATSLGVSLVLSDEHRLPRSGVGCVSSGRDRRVGSGSL